MKISRLKAKETEILVLDGTGVDVRGLEAGVHSSVRTFIESLRELSVAITEFQSHGPGGHKLTVVHGFAPAIVAGMSADSSHEPWLFDELVSTRQLLREALAGTGLWKVPSVFLGSGDCGGLVLEIACLCQVRIWLDNKSVIYGSPDDWFSGLTGSSPVTGWTRFKPDSGVASRAEAALWELSVEGARKVGFLDGCIDSTDRIQSLEVLIERIAPALLGGDAQSQTQLEAPADPGFRDALHRERQKAARHASGSSRHLLTAMARRSTDAAAAELWTVYQSVTGVAGALANPVAGPPRPATTEVTLVAPQVFGAAVDLSGGILAPGYFTDLASSKGLLLVTAFDHAKLPDRLDAQKAALAKRLGSARAQSFWERNVIPCAPGTTDPLSMCLPLVKASGEDRVELGFPDEGSWSLRLMPELAGATRSVLDGWRMVPAVVNTPIADIASPGALSGKYPGLLSLLRVFAGGALFHDGLDLASYRAVFHHLLVWQIFQSGLSLEEVSRELAGSGWFLDDLSVTRKILESAGMHRSRPPAAGTRVTPVAMFVQLHARTLATALAAKFSRHDEGQALLLDVFGVPAPELAVLSGDERPVRMTRLDLGSDEGVPFFSLVPWRPSRPIRGLYAGGVELPGTGFRQAQLQALLRESVRQMPQRIVDTVSKSTQIPGTYWANGLNSAN